jgi:hypothetical protein
MTNCFKCRSPNAREIAILSLIRQVPTQEIMNKHNLNDWKKKIFETESNLI